MDEDPMVQIDAQKLKAAIKAKFGSHDALDAYLAANGLSEGLSKRNVEKIISEGRIRQSSLSTIAEVLEHSDDYFGRAEKVPWGLPHQDWDRQWRPPGSLLRAEFEVVPFHFREVELKKLTDWCCQKGAPFVRIQLFTGAGGMGKTRLALELCRRLQADGWRSGFLDYSAVRKDEQRWDEMLAVNVPLLMVLDYAEHHRDILEWVIARCATRTPARSQVRLLLLARNSGDWWTQLRSRKDVGDLLSGAASYTHALAPLSVERIDRASSWRSAATRFAEKLGKPVPDRAPRDLGSEHFGRVLLLHMHALHSVEGVEGLAPADILEQVLLRERRFWSDQLQARDLPGDLQDGLLLFMAAATSMGGVRTQSGGLELLSRLSFFQGQPASVLESVNRMMAECYPGGRWIEPVQPDLLGDHLLNKALAIESFQKDLLAVMHGALAKS